MSDETPERPDADGNPSGQVRRHPFMPVSGDVPTSDAVDATEAVPSPAGDDETSGGDDDATGVAHDADDAPTEMLPPVTGEQPTAMMAPVSGPGAEDQRLDEPVRATADRNWMGVTAFVTGALGLSPVAIGFGHAGMAAARRGRATNRPFALAGAVLGYVGLVATVTVAALWLTAWGPAAQRAEVDVAAQQDAVAVGNAVASQWASGDAPTSVEQTSSGYRVDTTDIAASLTTAHTLTYVDLGPVTWCLMIEYDGGDSAAVNYIGDQGLVDGAHCEEPATEPSPSPSPSTDPSASPSASPTA